MGEVDPEEAHSCCRTAEVVGCSSWLAVVRIARPDNKLVVAVAVGQYSSPQLRLVAPLRRWNWVLVAQKKATARLSKGEKDEDCSG